MSEAHYLIDWIHRVEHDVDHNRPTKRRPSLVTELYFDRHLSADPALGLPPSLATGWMYRVNRNPHAREWFKVASNDDSEQRKASRRFILGMSASHPEDACYLIEHSIRAGTGTAPPALTFSVRQLMPGPEKLALQATPRALALGADMTQKTARALEGLASVVSDNGIAPWLARLSGYELQKLLATRCLMNFGGQRFTDIDGIGLTPDGVITFVEFKRKDPAAGRRYRLRHAPRMQDYLAEAEELNRRERQSRYGTAEEKAFHARHPPDGELKNQKKWEPVRDDCFGLDTSHAKNVLLCSENGWIYRHVIWNHPPAGADRLFTDRLSPRLTPDLLVLDVHPRHIDGIARAPGSKSGSYSVGIPRYQLMIKAGDFQRVQPGHGAPLPAPRY